MGPGESAQELASRVDRAVEAGDIEAAFALLEPLPRTAPETGRLWMHLGTRLAMRFAYESAGRALERAVHSGAGAPAHELSAAVHGELGDTPAAERELGLAVGRDPGSPSLALADATLLPMVYRDRDDLERWRLRYATRLGAFVAAAPRYAPRAAEILSMARSNFLLAYQGRDDRELQELLSGGLESLIRWSHPEWLEPRPALPRERLRVGFVSAFLHDCTVGRYFSSWILGLDPRRFEVRAYVTGPAHDAFTQRIASGCARFVQADRPVAEIARLLQGEQLDVLVFPEIGMDARTRLLACMRLAPVQAAGWGHPQTTGSRHIDAFLSCAEMEAEGSQAHYTERLVTLPGLGVDYAAPEVPPPFERAQLGFDEGQHLVFVPHSLFKLHPDGDEVLADVLAADPRAVLVVFQGQSSGKPAALAFIDRLLAALRGRGVPPARQVKLLPRLAPVEFRRALQLADVVVDPLHWSGGNTSLDALACGVPVATCPGPLMRSRQSAAMLVRLGVPELVARSPGELVRVALEVASRRELRESLAARIRGHREDLLGPAGGTEAFSRALTRLAAQGEGAARS